MIKEKKWKWYGNVGHFICGKWCRFHLCTEIGNYLISTVGEYVHPRHGRGKEDLEMEWLKENYPGEDIGCNRKYETMVFKIDPNNRCTEPTCGCGLPEIDGYEQDFGGYNIAKDATAGHMELCQKYAELQ